MAIQNLSMQSLFLEMMYEEVVISTATGFIVNDSSGTAYLITNRHNVTGRDQTTGKPLDEKNACIPNKVAIWHHVKDKPGEWCCKKEKLYSSETEEIEKKPLWIEHPTLKGKADFIALKLTELEGVELHQYAYNLSPSAQFILSPPDMVHVIGFPFGKKAGGYLGIWSTGFMASEPEIDYDDLPVFLIDCYTRLGQSGSPVIVYKKDMNNRVIHGVNPSNTRGTLVVGGKDFNINLLGIYSGRIHKESNIGMVWKTSSIKELIDSIQSATKTTYCPYPKINIKF